MTRPSVLAWSLCGFALVIAAVGVVLHVMSWSVFRSTGFTPRGFAILLAVAFGVVGAIVASRTPRNAIGWIFTVAGIAAAGQYSAEQFAYVVADQPGSPLLVPAALVAGVLGSMNSLATAIALLYLFPSGRFLDRRDRIFASGGFVASAVVVTGLSTVLESLPAPFAGIANPLFRPGAAPVAIPITVAAMVVAIGAVVMGVRALVRRFRRSAGIERLQLKWFVFVWTLSGITLALAYVATFISYVEIGEAVFTGPPLVVRALVWANIGTFVLIAPAVGVAILRYRLYDVDILIRRTIVYGTTTAGIAVAFFAGIVVLQGILRPLTSGSEAAVAISTLASVALFQPLRTRLQHAVDRRFYRSRYDAARTLDDFSVRLRDQVALDAVRANLLDAVRETVQPAHASVWLRERAG